MNFLKPLKSLKETLFTRLYFAQAISLIGDACTWIGIALLAFDFGEKKSAEILATALTLRVAAFIVFGSYAGVLADRFNRKKILVITNFARMFIVLLLVMVTAVWQLYVLIFLLNVFNAFFTPAYKACIPQLIKNKDNYANAITLSNATWQLLGILGPGLAGALAVWLGSRQIFLFDALSFVLSSILVLMIPMTTLKKEKSAVNFTFSNFGKDIIQGTKLLFQHPPIRFALLIELGAAIAGAQVLVNTVGHIKGNMLLTDREYGWAMTAFGIGATVAAFTANTLDQSRNKTTLLIWGTLILAASVSLGNLASYPVLLLLWIFAGLGQSYTELPSQIIIAENIKLEQQGKAYGSHFAWSHLWWAIAYPIAGITGTVCSNNNFLIGGITAILLLICIIAFSGIKSNKQRENQSHETP